MIPQRLADLGKGHRIGQAVTANQEGAVGLGRNLVNVDEILVIRVVTGRSDVAVNLISSRVRHGFGFGQLPAVLEFADGGMVAGDFFERSGAGFVEAGIPNMANGRGLVGDEGDGQDARHAFPVRALGGCVEDGVVGERDGFTNSLLRRAGRALQAAPEPFTGDLGRVFPGGVPAHAVDDQIDAALVVEGRPGLRYYCELPDRSRRTI